ncbi:MAG TPA: Hsp20 family protein, partial [Halococcus sp.]|nr:Hsp20 family protein [Halococcus sp.]
EMRFPGRGLALDGKVKLPAAVDPENATARLSDTGTLEIELPKRVKTTDEPIRISMDEQEDTDNDTDEN